MCVVSRYDSLRCTALILASAAATRLKPTGLLSLLERRGDRGSMRGVQLSLKSKLRLGFGIVLAVSLAVFGFAYLTALRNASADDWVQHTDTVIGHATECLIALGDMEARSNEVRLTGSAAARAMYEQDLATIDAQLDTLSGLTADNPPQVQRWQAIRAQVDALDLSGGSATEQFVAVRTAFSVPINVEQQLLLQRARQADQDNNFLQLVLIGGAAAIVALGLICAAVLSNSIGKSMERLARVAQAIAAGDLNQRVGLERQDEIGRAAAAFDSMANALQQDLEQRTRIQAETESLLNAAGEGIFGVDRRGRLTMMNAAAQEMTGYSFEEVRGRSLHATLHHSRPDGSPYPPQECPTGQAMQEGKPLHVRGEVFWRKDMSSLPVDFTAVPIKSGGHVTGAVMTFHDISQQLAIDRMKDEFIGVVSHELRTPLTSIRASLGLLASGMLGAAPDQAKRMVDLALNNTERLVRLVNDILDVERIESGKTTMQLQQHDARELVEKCLESLAPMATGAGVRLVSSAESVSVCVDSDRIVQALTNLVGNAIKFSQPGSVVNVTAQRKAGAVQFSVADQGRGIPRDKLESIFRRFEQVDVSDSKHKGGTGLGLPIARSIVRQHGGDMWVESVPSKGSTFYFTIPA